MYSKINGELEYINAVKCFKEMNLYLNHLETQIYRRSYIKEIYQRSIER